MVFSQIDWSKIDDPNFGQEMVAQLDDAVARGARGLKQLKDLGLSVRDKWGKLVAVDDPRLDPIWEECGRLGIPVVEERWPALVDAATLRHMRERADHLAPNATERIWRDNRQFFHRAGMGEWRDLLDAEDLRRYRARVNQLATSDLAEWVHHDPGWANET